MQLITTPLALFVLYSFVAAIFKLPPFKKRWQALLTSIVSFVIFGAVAPTTPEKPADNSKLADAKPPERQELISNEELFARIERSLSSQEFVKAAYDLNSLRYSVTDADKAKYAEMRETLARQASQARLSELAVASSAAQTEFSHYETAFFELVTLVGKETPLVDSFEAAVLEKVRAIPTENFRQNALGYNLLSKINAENSSYAEKAADYRQKEREKPLVRFAKEYDKVSKTAFYTNTNAPRFLNSRSTVYLYIGMSGESEWLRMKTIYTAGDWLFVDRVIAYFDGESIQLTAGDFNRDNNTDIWEWRDEVPTTTQIEALKKLASAKDAVLRYEGQQYRRDVTLGVRDKTSIIETLMAYEQLRQ